MTGQTLCPHGDRDWRCPTCCLAELRRNHPRLMLAVQVRDKTGGSGGRTPFGSREPINVGALALLQDVMAAGGLDRVEEQLATRRDPALLAALRKQVRQWRSRSALILKDALAPYPLTWDTHSTNDKGEPTVVTRPIPCPVVTAEGNCPGTLDVHRDNDPASLDFGKAAVIRCNRDDDHEWTLQAGGWLRLGVLLGGVA